MAATRAQLNRAVRQEALREQLSKQGHVQSAVDIIKQLTNLDNEMDSVEVQRLGKAMEGHFKFISKYMPELKATELTGEGGEDLTIGAYEIKFTK